MSGKSILVVDDDKNICRLVESALKQNGFGAVSADSGENALLFLKENSFDVIILDILLPGMDGLETLRQIRANPAHQNLPVIMLTSKNSEFDSVIGLELGADDYVGKPIRYYELIARIKTVLRRSEKLSKDSPAKIEMYSLQIDTVSRSVHYQGSPLTLSYKEFELLTLLAKKPGRVFTREEILDAVWQEDYSLETRTVDVHIRRLRRKFEETGSKSSLMIETIRNVGYRLTGI